MVKVLNIKCNHCGAKRKFEWRRGSILNKTTKCFRCGRGIKIHTHIDKHSTII